MNFACIGYYDGEFYTWFDNLKDYFNFLFTVQDNTDIYFHFGGGYDFLFLLDYAFRNHKSYQVEELIPRGSSFLSVKIRGPKGKIIRLLDSSALLPFGLRTLATNFNVETLKGDIDYDKIKKITPKLLKYMKDDHFALHQVLTKYKNHPMIQRVGLKMTRSGQAFALYNQHYLKERITPLRKNVEEFCRKAYQGGRTEIFKPMFLGNKKNRIACVDVNSLYPSVMRNYSYPIRFNGFSSSLNLDVLSIWEVTVNVPQMRIPPLGVVHEGKYIFACGTFSGHWTNIELKMAMQFGVKIVSVKMGALFNSGGKIFKEYIDEMYALRKASPKNSADNIIYKDMMNHLYGRFALDKDKEKIVIDGGQVGVRPYLDIPLTGKNACVKLALEKTELKSFTFAPIAIFVTSYARCENYMRYLHPYQNDVYYTDTDSFFLPEKIVKKMPIDDELGGLKIEYTREQACFLLPKTYILSGGGDRIIKMKGFDKKKISHFSLDDFTSCLEGELKLTAKVGKRIAKFKESLRRNKKVLSVLEESCKTIKTKYSKRQTIKTKSGYDTVPLTISEN